MTISGQCPACKAPLAVQVGRKSTSRSVACACGAVYDYSCWVIRTNAERTVHKIELFPRVTR